MKKHEFEFSSGHTIEGIEERVLDEMCGMFSTNIKDAFVELTFDDCYKRTNVELDNGKILRCEIAYDPSDQWLATVWEASEL